MTPAGRCYQRSRDSAAGAVIGRGRGALPWQRRWCAAPVIDSHVAPRCWCWLTSRWLASDDRSPSWRCTWICTAAHRSWRHTSPRAARSCNTRKQPALQIGLWSKWKSFIRHHLRIKKYFFNKTTDDRCGFRYVQHVWPDRGPQKRPP